MNPAKSQTKTGSKLASETRSSWMIFPPSKITLLLRRTTPMSGHVRHERCRVPRLQEHCAWAGELAHQAFARSFARYDASARRPFEHILAVPSHEMAVINDVLLVGLQLDD